MGQVFNVAHSRRQAVFAIVSGMHFPLFFLLLVIALDSPLAFAQWHQQERAIMGTAVRVELWDEDANHAQAAMAAVMDEMERINQLMSPHIASSELARINREAAARDVEISAEMFLLISKAQRISRLSNGAFDITFAALGERYDYRQAKAPSETTVKALLPAINYRHIKLNEQNKTIRFDHSSVVIDLGGIAKGHAVDRSIALLAARGIEHALVTAGGDTRLLGDKRGRPWMVAIKDPRNADKQAVVMPLEDIAISTSGDYERFFLDGDERVHHILNPASGKSAGAVQSVSIIAADATTTDGLSTTVFVLGVEKGLALVNSLPGVDAVIIDNQHKVHYSSELLLHRASH
jgi:thiamine biosynthesis lipoprotein